jgi:hypothetical protein
MSTGSMLLVAVLRPVDVEVDRLPIELVAVLKPVDVEVDRLPMLNSWPCSSPST